MGNRGKGAAAENAKLPQPKKAEEDAAPENKRAEGADNKKKNQRNKNKGKGAEDPRIPKPKQVDGSMAEGAEPKAQRKRNSSKKKNVPKQDWADMVDTPRSPPASPSLKAKAAPQ